MMGRFFAGRGYFGRLKWKIASPAKSTRPQPNEKLIKTPINSPSRNGASSSSSQYPIYHQQQQLQQQQFFHQHQITKSKRSKSMDDFGSQMVFEQSSRVQRNNVRNGSGYHPSSSSSSQMGKRSPQNNGMMRANIQHPPQPQHKNQMRYSVDNLLEIDTSYYNNYQVRPDGFDDEIPC
jgi:hypothetical protein